MSSVERRPTRAQQRAATRLSILDATVACLVDEGYAGLSTRRVAERAGVAQSTVMHHFPTREAFLVEAVTHLALRLADETLEAIDLTQLTLPAHREAVLDQAWKQLSSPAARAAAQLWAAAWAEPELAATLRDIEDRLTTIFLGATLTFFPAMAEDTRLPALLDAAITLMRGLVHALPVSGEDAVERRWEAMKPILLQAAAAMLDGATPSPCSALRVRPEGEHRGT